MQKIFWYIICQQNYRLQSFLEKHSTFFSEKRKFADKTTLEDREENILSDETLVSEELNIFFQNETKTLNINENSYIVDSRSSITDPVDKAINTYKNHPSILLIKQKLENEDHFLFKEGFYKWSWERIEGAKFQ